MTVTKRTRYEVLRRDNNTCRYCHATDQPLTIDHVVPTALGGSDNADNLVAACRDCNAGKTSSSPDAPLVSDVAEDTIRWAAARQAAIKQIAADEKPIKAARKKFLAAWREWDPALTYLAADWHDAVEQWIIAGLTADQIIDSLNIARGKRHVYHRDVFRYAAGVCWNKIKKIDEATQQQVAAQPADSEEEATVTLSLPEYEEICDREFSLGWDRGYLTASAKFSQRDCGLIWLEGVVDNKRQIIEQWTAFKPTGSLDLVAS